MADGTLDFEIRIKNAENEINKLKSQFSGLGATVQQQSSIIDQSLSNPLKSATSLLSKFGAAFSVGAFTKQLIEVRGEFQKTEIAFETMLGSKEKAEALNAQLLETAARTPFDMGSITSSAKQLLAYGVAAEDVNETLVTLGDIAAGVGSDIKDLSYLYGTTMVQGQMYTQDLRQFQGRGIGIAKEIAKVMDIEESAVADAVSKGLVTADIFNKAIRNMASEGGQFYNLMAKQSQSLSGQVSNLGDAFQRMMNEIGKASEGALSGGINAVSVLIENYKTVAGIIATVTAAYGAHKASVMALAAVYEHEAEILQSVYAEEEQVIDAKLREAVANGELSQAQALEIEKMRELLPEKEKQLKKSLELQEVELESAKIEVETAEEMLSSAKSEIEALQQKQTATEKAVESARELGDAEQVQKLMTEQGTIAEELNTAAKELNTAEELKRSAVKRKATAEIAVQTTQTKLNTVETTKNVAATKAQSVAQALGAKVTKTFRAAMSALNKTMLANPVFWIVAGVAALATAIYKVATYESDSEKATRKANEAKAEASKQAEIEKKKLGELVSALDKYEKGSDEYKSAKQSIIDQYSQYLPNLDKEFDKLTEQGMLYETLATKITKAANAKAFFQLKDEATEKMMDAVVNEKGDIYDKLLKAYGKEEADRLMSKFNSALDEGRFYEKEGKLYRPSSKDKDFAKIYDADDIAGGEDVLKDIQRIVDAQNAYNDQVKKGMAILDIDAATASGINTQEEEQKRAAEKKKATEEEQKRQEEYQKELTRLSENAEKERLDLFRSTIRDKHKLLDEDYKNTLKQISKEEEAFKKKYGQNADTSSFDQRRENAEQKKNLGHQNLNEQLNDYVNSIDLSNVEDANKEYMRGLEKQLEYTDDINTQIEIQNKLREKSLELQLQQVEREKEQAIESQLGADVLDRYKSGKLSGEEKARVDSITDAYDIKASNIQRKSENEQYQEELERAKKYAEELLQIEQWKAEQIKSIRENESLDETQKQTKIDEVEAIASYDESQIAELLGADTENIATLLNGMLMNVMNQGYLEIVNQIEMIEQELAKAQEQGDPKKVKQLNAQLNLLKGSASKARSEVGQVGKEGGDSAEKIQKQYKKADAVLSAVNDTCDMLIDSFGDYLSSTAVDGLNTIKSVSSGVMAMIGSIVTLSKTGSEAVKGVERASVILTVISAALSVVMAIANFITRNFSQHAQLQQMIDDANKRVEEHNRQLERLEFLQDEMTGRDFWANQCEQIKEATKAVEDAEEAYRLAQEQAANATTDKKKEEAEENAKEAESQWQDTVTQQKEKINEFYEGLSTTDLTSFSESLAESLVEGFDNGLSSMDEVWDNAMNDLMKSMLTKQMQMELEKKLEPVFKKIKDSFSYDSNDTELTEAEIQNILSAYESAQSNAQNMVDAYRKIYEQLGLNIDTSELEGSSGGFESMSQDTADELNGRFTALQISGANIQMSAMNIDTNVGEIVRQNNSLLSNAMMISDQVSIVTQIAQSQLNELRIIGENTQMLHSVNKYLKSIDNNINTRL